MSGIRPSSRSRARRSTPRSSGSPRADGAGLRPLPPREGRAETGASAPAGAGRQRNVNRPRRVSAPPRSRLQARVALPSRGRRAVTGALAVDLAVNGLITGLFYALMAIGLSLIFGILRVVNFA